MKLLSLLVQISKSHCGNCLVVYPRCLYMYLVQVIGLYKGVLPPLVMQGTINAIVFGVYGVMSRCLAGTRNGEQWRGEHIAGLSGMTAGLCQSSVCAPMELVKLHVQNQGIGTNHGSKGNWKTLSDTYKVGKLRGIYRGLLVTASRDVVGFGTYFFCYESLMQYSTKKTGQNRENLSTIFPFVNGGIAGACSWLINFPVDTVKSRYQVDGAENQPFKYRNARDCFSKILKEGGIRLLYNGLSMGLLRAFVNSAFLFPAYEFSKRFLSDYV